MPSSLYACECPGCGALRYRRKNRMKDMCGSCARMDKPIAKDDRQEILQSSRERVAKSLFYQCWHKPCPTFMQSIKEELQP